MRKRVDESRAGLAICRLASKFRSRCAYRVPSNQTALYATVYPEVVGCEGSLIVNLCARRLLAGNPLDKKKGGDDLMGRHLPGWGGVLLGKVKTEPLRLPSLFR